VRRCLQQRGIPLRVHVLDADVEQDPPALIVQRDHLGRERTTGECERREHRREEESAAHQEPS